MDSNTEQILNVSFVIILFFFAIAVSGVGFSGYRSTLGGRKFEYRFDKTRWPLWRRSVLGIMSICFVYALIVTRNVGGGIAFSLLISPFAMLTCLLSVCYVPLDFKKAPAQKQTKKRAKTSSKNNWKLP